MDYTTLLKLYYKDRGKYKEEYEKRITSQNTVRLDFNVNKNEAFFTETPEVSSLARQILKTDKRIAMLIKKLPGVAINQFGLRCLVDEIHLTNKMEGVRSTRREISDVINEINEKEAKEKKRKRLYGLVTAYMNLWQGKETPLETPQDIRNIYDEIVLPDVIDEDPSNAPDGVIFRKDMATVYTQTDREIHSGVYPEKAIISEMEKALSILKDDSIELLYRSALFHYMLEYIHPFYDGNGRLGRFIVSYLLTKEMEPLLAYRLSFTITENINEYYEAFKVCNDPKNLGDTTPFVLMMLKMIQRSAEALEEALSKRLLRLGQYEDMVDDLIGAENERERLTYSALIQAGLFAEYGISTKKLMAFLGLSYVTAKKELAKVEALDLLVQRKVGRENFYSLNLDKLDEMLFCVQQEAKE